MEIPPPIDRFLRDAADLTLDQWTEVYWRFVRDPLIMKAVRKFAPATVRAWLDQRETLSVEQRSAYRRISAQIMAAVQAVLAPLPEDVLDARGGRLRQRTQFIITSVIAALEHAETMNADPTCRNAVRRFLAVFDGIIAFPEFQ